ncbi:MAG TPA: LptF/LptG family permease [Bryobacteraceae bacterium]|nr:LptF/LptG family permease [Bryobacteraceae bacterium]
MRILSRYIFREIVSSAVLGTALATFVVFLQQVDKLFEMLVRSSTHTSTVLWLFVLALPPVLPLTVPFGVLVGILIGLGRMSTDGEVIAMRAAGVSSRSVIPPVLAFALLGTILTGTAALWLTPRAMRRSIAIVNKVAAEQLTADIQPRVFDEQFTNTILYVGDVKTGKLAVWKNVFLADLTPPEQRTIGLRDKAQGPRVTVAREAIAVPDPAHNRIQLSLRNASSHEVDDEGAANDSVYTSGEQALDASPSAETHPTFRAMNTGDLKRYSRTGADWIEARIELHQRRLAYPLACLTLALVGIPLGVSSRKGGKSAGYITALFLAFFCYHMASLALVGLAKQRALPVELAVWAPNAAFLIAGLILMARMEAPGDRDLLGTLRGWFTNSFSRFRPRLDSMKARPAGLGRSPWLPLFPQIVDTYVLTSFVFYFVVMLASFVMLTEIYNFFELLSDIIRNNIPMSKVFTYLFFLAPMLIYKMLPISVLVAVLVTFGVMTKHNEVTAFKACGVSLHRLAVPVLTISGLFSVGLFAFDHFYLPETNRKQDALHNEIKGKASQTYLHPDRPWIFGKGSRIWYYKYSLTNMMGVVHVYLLDPNTFDLEREIYGERAEWQPSLHTWIFQNGWVRQVRLPDAGESGKVAFERFQVKTFSELDESPEYFMKKMEQGMQMNFQQLEAYIGDLQQSGFDTVRLRVQLYDKFSIPLFALIMAMISIPFAFLVGNRGAMAGIGVSIGIAMAYWGIGKLFEQIGNANQLPPTVAAWAPDTLFALAGVYLLLRMRS